MTAPFSQAFAAYAEQNGLSVGYPAGPGGYARQQASAGLAGPQMLVEAPEGSLFPGLSPKSPCDSTRVVKSGGALVDHLMHPTFVPFEQQYRKLPTGAIFDASPQNNYRFELGSFVVPSAMALALVDYRFDIYRPSGAAPGDTVPIEARRLSTMVGYDVTISKYRKGQVQYQLVPTEPIAAQQATQRQKTGGVIAAGADFAGVQPGFSYDPSNPFPPSAPPFGATAADFAAARANASATPGGAGLALLPQRPERQGAPNLPFTYVVQETQRLKFEVVVFNPVPIPISFFEVAFSGVLMPATTLAEIYKAVSPCGGVP